MKTLDLTKLSRRSLKHLVLAIAVAAGLSVGSAQALTTTATFNLGTEGNGTSIPNQSYLSPAWIAAGTLPAGSILRSVSIDARLDTEGGGDTYADDLFVYVDPGAPPSGSEILQVGGYDALGSPTTRLTWANGGNGTLGTTCVDTKNAGTHFPDTIDLNSAGVFLGSRGLIPATWSGTVTVEYDVFVPAAILSFGPGAVVGPLAGNAAAISWTVPFGTNVTALTPTFTLSSGTCDRDNGGPTAYDFTNPVVYTVTDGATINTFTVTVTAASALRWNVAGGGDWNTSTANWLPLPSGPVTTFANGNEVVFDNTAGGTIVIALDMSPASTTVSAASGTYAFVGGPIANGSLTKSGGGILQVMGVASIPPTGAAPVLSHTYSGGTVINGGRLILGSIVNSISPNVVNPVGSGLVTLNAGTLEFQRVTANNALTVSDGATLFQNNGWGATWSGPVTLNGTATANINFGLNLTGNISGPGGFTKTGGGTLTLTGTNGFTGPVSVTAGTLKFSNIAALGSGDLSISGTGKVNLDFTGSEAIASLTLGGVEQTATGTYGSPTSDAIFKSSYFIGNGTVKIGEPESAAYITSFGTNVAGSAAVIGTVASNAADITWYVPSGTNLATLAPEFVLTSGSTSSNQTSGSIPTPGFDAGPVNYTIVSQNTLVTNVYTVTVTILPAESTLIWNLASGSAWNRTSPNWRGESSGFPTPYYDGVNVIFNNTAGGTIVLDGNLAPLSTTVNATSGTYTFGVAVDGGAITTGSLTKDGGGTLLMAKANSYDGGTVINSGKLLLEWPGDGVSHTTLGSGPVTLNGGTLHLNRVDLANALTVNGGSIIADNGFGSAWTGPITLNAPNLNITSYYKNHPFSGAISGSGGFTLIGSSGGGLALSGTNDYAGPTIVTSGTLQCDSPGALGGGALSINGKVNLNYALGTTRNIASLTLGGVAKTDPGTYGSVASGATFPDDTYFTTGSTGTVTIGGGSDYDTWLAEFTFAPGADKTPTGDPDGDDMSNQEEYAFGLNPTLGSSVNPIVTLLDPATGNFQYTRRATPAATGLTYTVLTSTTLAGWASGGATETGFTTAGNIQTVTVNVTTPPVDGKLFVRVQAAPTL